MHCMWFFIFPHFFLHFLPCGVFAYELRFPLLLDTMIANTEFESDGCSTNSPGPEKKRKRGLGKGGAAAKYQTMSVAAHMAQFLDEPFEERLNLLNQPMMWCLACGSDPHPHFKWCRGALFFHDTHRDCSSECTLRQHPAHAVYGSVQW